MTDEALGGVYVHLPFCPYICPYCDFAKWPLRRSDADRYLATLHREIAESESRRAENIFLGGGTPNAYDAVKIVELVARLNERFPAADSQRETTIEVNPDAVRPGDIDAYARAGINRLSIGVQSFREEESRALGRRHSNADVERCVRDARSAGIRSLSVDLIFALPGQSEADWMESLDAAVALGVDHCSTYGLTIEPGTPFERLYTRAPDRFADEEHEARLYEIAMDRLGAAGFEHYEISNFARPGHRSRHNENYWKNGSYLGLGVGAASYLEGERSTASRSLTAYMEAVERGEPVPRERERLDGLARLGEAMMLALRTAQGVDASAFNQRYGIDPLVTYASTIAEFIEAGVLERSGEHLRLTRRGRLLANTVCGAFVTLE